MPTRSMSDAEILEDLRAAAKDGFDELDRGEGLSFDSSEELKAYLNSLVEKIEEEISIESRSA